MSTIKAGYRVTVTSWENDGDNYNTLSKDGMTAEAARLVYQLLSLLEGDLGNMYEPDEEECELLTEAVIPIIKQNLSILGEFGYSVYKQSDVDFPMYATQVATSIIGDFTGFSEGYYTRKVESIVVEYVPAEIVIQDVTHEFME